MVVGCCVLFCVGWLLLVYLLWCVVFGVLFVVSVLCVLSCCLLIVACLSLFGGLWLMAVVFHDHLIFACLVWVLRCVFCVACFMW